MTEYIKISLLHAIKRLEEADEQLAAGASAVEVQLNVLSALAALRDLLEENNSG